MKKYLSVALFFFVAFQSLAYALEPFVLITNQKSGTFYLRSILEDATGLPSKFHCRAASNDFFGVCHCANQFLPDAQNILLIRDPREVLISYAHFVTKQAMKSKKSWLGDKRALFLSLSLQDKIRYLLDLDNPFELKIHMSQLGKRYAQSKIMANVLCVRFEELVGPKGGGSLMAQIGALRRIRSFIDLKMSTMQLLRIADRRWGKTGTFRRGVIGRWQEDIDRNLAEEIKASVWGPLIIQLGYAEDENW